MASITPHSIAAGSSPVDDECDAALGRLIVEAAALAEANITRGLGIYGCEECAASWTPTEHERHVDGCRTGRVRRTLALLCAGFASRSAERMHAEPVSAAAAGRQPHGAFEYGEPWRYGFHATLPSARPGLLMVTGDWVETERDATYERIVACVNYCAGVSSELLESLIPLRELGIGVTGAGQDALLGKKGGAR